MIKKSLLCLTLLSHLLLNPVLAAKEKPYLTFEKIEIAKSNETTHLFQGQWFHIQGQLRWNTELELCKADNLKAFSAEVEMNHNSTPVALKSKNQPLTFLLQKSDQPCRYHFYSTAVKYTKAKFPSAPNDLPFVPKLKIKKMTALIIRVKSMVQAKDSDNCFQFLKVKSLDRWHYRPVLCNQISLAPANSIPDASKTKPYQGFMYYAKLSLSDDKSAFQTAYPKLVLNAFQIKAEQPQMARLQTFKTIETPLTIHKINIKIHLTAQKPNAGANEMDHQEHKCTFDKGICQLPIKNPNQADPRGIYQAQIEASGASWLNSTVRPEDHQTATVFYGVFDRHPNILNWTETP
jgi:hypothetical protein